MKLINKFLIGSLCMGLLTLTSCTKGDDDGPAEPAYQGTFTGSLTDYTVAAPAASDFIATSITAIHDTTAFANQPAVKIEVVNSAGVKIILQLQDTTARLAPYVLRGSSTSKSTITLGTNNGPFTTVSDDIPGEDKGSVSITDGGMNDGILKGTITYIIWVEVDSNDDDLPRAVMENGSFEVPLVRKGLIFEGSDADLTAKIDNVAFDPLSISSSGFNLTAIDATFQSISVNLPQGATLGEHDVNSSSEYQVFYSIGGSAYTSEGTMNISAFDANAGTATGTFQFTATSGTTTVEITEGNFTF